MIGGLVEQQEIGGLHEHAGQRVTVSLAAGEDADGLEHIVLGEEKAAQDAAQFGVGGARRDGGKIVDHARLRVELLVLVLGEIIGLRVVAQGVLAGADRLGPGQDLDHGRFARAVDAHQRHAVAALDVKVDAGEDGVIAVGSWRRLLNSATMRPLGLGCGKAEVDGLLLGGNFDALDLFQFLDAALHLLGLGGLVAEAVDEGF